MAAVKKTLVVEDLRKINSHPETAFSIKKVTNSIHFKIGEYLNANTVDAYCIHPEWTVHIVGR